MLTILDCDGVLIDSEIVAAKALAKSLTKHGFPIDADGLITRFAGMTDEEIYRVLEEESGRKLPEDFAAGMAEEIDSLLADVVMIPGADEMLDRIEGPRAVCSNSRTSRLQVSLGAVGLWERVQPNVFSAVEVGDLTPKPSPNVYLYAAKLLGFDPADVAVVEDSVHGVTGAVRAGMRVIGFIGASHSWVGHGEALMDAGAETIVRRLSEVPPVLAAFREWRGLGG